MVPPFAAFFMKVLSFSLNDEAPVEAVSAALTAPVRLIATIITASICNCETTLILVFMLYWVELPGAPQPQIQIEGGRLVGRETITLLALLAWCYDSEIFRSYERSTRCATSR